MNLIAHSLRLLAFCFGHDAGLEMVVVVVVVVGYGHMYDARTRTVLALAHGLLSSVEWGDNLPVLEY